MSDVAGITELMALQHMADPEVKGYGEKEGARIEALLRNRQELVQVVERFLSPSVVDGEYQIAADTLRKAKELGND